MTVYLAIVLTDHAVQTVGKLVDARLPRVKYVLQGPDVADGHMQDVNLAQFLALALAQHRVWDSFPQTLEA